MKGKHIYFNVAIYNIPIFVSLNQSDKDFFKYVLKFFTIPKEYNLPGFSMEGSIASGKWLLVNHPQGGGIMRISGKLNTPKTLGTLHHEITHATIDILTQAGLKLSNDSEEAFCYLNGYLTREILQRLV